MQMPAEAEPPVGTVYYDVNTNTVRLHDGVRWVNIPATLDGGGNVTFTWTDNKTSLPGLYTAKRPDSPDTGPSEAEINEALESIRRAQDDAG